MNNVLIAVILIISVDNMVFAQTRALTGFVRDEKGLPVSSASVLLMGTKKGLSVDSLGYFKMNIKSNTGLVISAVGYDTDTVTVAKTDYNLSIVLKKKLITTEKIVVQNSSQTNSEDSAGNVPKQYGNTLTASLTGMTPSQDPYTGAYLPEFTPKQDTKGTRYLFDKWLGGIVTDTGNHVIDNKKYLFNYDKISGGMLMTQDMKSAIEINRNQVKVFSLNGENGRQYIFELAPLIENGNLVEQLAKGDKYILYKSIRTKFIKEDYHNDGMMERGHPYDEFKDEFHYYILPAGSKGYQEVQLKKKSIKAILSSESTKVNGYFSQHANYPVNENFLIGLITFLNQ